MTTKHWLYIALHAIMFVLGLLAMSQKGVAFQAVGASLIAAGIAGWVIFLYLFVSSRAAERIALIESSGIREVFAHRSIAIRHKYELRVKKAREAIDIIGYGLRALREDLGAEFEAWSQRVNVRILLIDPDFPDPNNSLADLRDAEEKNPKDSIRQDVRAFVSQCAELMKGNARFRIRLYRAIPAINYFRVDDDAFWGPFFVGAQSRNMPAILVERAGFLFQPLHEHFERLWSDQFSREIPVEWLSNK
jgi:hypothetical protein